MLQRIALFLLMAALALPLCAAEPVDAGSAALASVTMVDINRADAEALASGLVGVGPSKAEAIVADRQANGPFQSVDDLARVQGIGVKTVELNRERITLTP
jgi:competence protein ComEA